MGTIGTVSEKVINLISAQITPHTSEFDSDATYEYHIPCVTPETLASAGPAEAVLMEESEPYFEITESEDTEEDVQIVERSAERSRPKSYLNDVYEKVEIMAASQITKNKKKVKHICDVTDMKRKMHEIDLKIKEEELAAKRRKHEAEEEESKLRIEILKVELEIAKAKLN